MVTAADRTDRDVAREMRPRLRLMHPELACAWADSAYAGTLVTWAHRFLILTVAIVARPARCGRVRGASPPLDRGTHARLDHPGPRNVRDYERLPARSEAHITWAAITLMTRRLTRASGRTAPGGQEVSVSSLSMTA